MSVTDFMPVGEDGRPSEPHPEIHRHLRGRRGRVPMEMVFMPRFEYGARVTRLEVLRAGLFATDRTDQVLTLSSAQPFEWVVEQSTATTRFPLEKGEKRWLVLRYDDDDIHPVDRYESARKLDITAAYWQRWSSRVRYGGPFRGDGEALGAGPQAPHPRGDRRRHRRADDLPSRDDRRGAQLGLPLRLAPGRRVHAGGARRRGPRGGGRRSSCGSSRRSAVTRAAATFRSCTGSTGAGTWWSATWITSRAISGRGRCASGTERSGQLQLDVYGEVLETAEIWRRNHEMTEGTWRVLRGLVDWVSHNWHLPDSSIWEVRGEVRHYVFSKVMSWVALDRGVRMAEDLAWTATPRRGGVARDALQHEIMERGWSEQRQSFVQAYDSDTLDAAALAIPMVRFLPWTDPRVHSTVRAIARELTTADGELVYRYRQPGRTGGGGGCLLDLHLLAGPGPGHDRRPRAGRPGLPANAPPRESRRSVLGGDRSCRRASSWETSLRGFTHIALINCAAAFARLDRSAR